VPSLVSAVKKGRFAWIGGGRHLTATTHVDNTVEGLVLGAARGKPGAAYFVTDGEPAVFREFISELLSANGVEPPERNLPAPLASVLATTGETVWRGLRLKRAPPITRLAYWLSAQECTIDISRARAELGYEPVRTREDGLEELRQAASA
jgi:nucleoside-diphosphate-sugar epimerase